MFERSWVRFLSGTQIFSLSNTHVMLISSLFRVLYFSLKIYLISTVFFFSKFLVIINLNETIYTTFTFKDIKQNQHKKETNKQIKKGSNTWKAITVMYAKVKPEKKKRKKNLKGLWTCDLWCCPNVLPTELSSQLGVGKISESSFSSTKMNRG